MAESTFPLHAPYTLVTPILSAYIPTPSRRLLITHLPPQTHLYTLLRKVHSGPLLSVTILETTPILGSRSALIEFVHHENATTFLHSLPSGTITIESEGGALELPITRLPASSAPIPPRVSVPIQHGASRLLVTTGFPRRCVFPFLVEAGLHRGWGLQSVVEASYAEDARGAGTGRLRLELASVAAAHAAESVLSSRRGLMARLPGAMRHFFGRDPCRRGAALATPAGLPLNVADPACFFSLGEFLDVPLSPSLPDPHAPVSTTRDITTTLGPSPCLSAGSPARVAAHEFAVDPWTHTDPETGARRVRVPFGWSTTPEDALRDFVLRGLGAPDARVAAVVDDYFTARGLVNLRKLVALGRRWVCAANLWGILEG